MAVVTKSIGTGGGHDYSTITAWEADLDNGAVYASGDDAVGECYDDSAFNESVTINGGTTIGLNSIRLTVAAGERHDGTAGTGARIVRTASGGLQLGDGVRHIDLLWLEVDMNGNAGDAVIATNLRVDSLIGNLILHGGAEENSSLNAIALDSVGGAGDVFFVNSIIYDFREFGSATPRNVLGVFIDGGEGASVYNVTIQNLRTDHASNAGNAIGVSLADNSANRARNVLVADISVAGAGTAACFAPATPSSAVMNHNAGDDGTQSGTGSISIVAADEFVSTVGGAEDYHLKSGADCIDAGTDLGTSPAGVNIDIDGRDRDAEGDTWDIGADEFVDEDDGVEGAGGFTLGGLQVSANGAEEIPAAAAISLGGLSVSATAAMQPEGAGAMTLGEVILAAAATSEFNASGAADVVLGPVEIAADAVMQPEGAGAILLSQALLAGLGVEEIPGAGSVLLDGIDIVAAAIEAIDGAGAIVLGAAEIDAITELTIAGNGDIRLGAVSLLGDGAVVVPGIGAGEITLSRLIIAAIVASTSPELPIPPATRRALFRRATASRPASYWKGVP